jgi:acyl-CoA thioester hydrolase
MDSDASFQPLRIELAFPVRTYDIDFVGVVNNIVYVRWLEDLRLKLLEEHLPLDRLMASGQAPILSATHIEYLRSVKLFDPVIGRMWLEGLGSAKWTVRAVFIVNGTVMAAASQTGVFVSTRTMRPVRIPEALRAKFERAKAP